jgi:hypothetical protein
MYPQKERIPTRTIASRSIPDTVQARSLSVLDCREGNTMGKDLRTLAVPHKLQRYPRLDGTLWGLKTPQPFFPPLETLFKTETVGSLGDYGIRLGEGIDAVTGDAQIRTTKGATIPIHRKTTMLLSPFKWMRGDYGVLGLPKPEAIATDVQAKLQSPHSAGYVGALASIALSESGCVHFPTVYGVYVGLAASHTIDISDDYEELSDRHWFANNLGSTFELKLRQVPGAEFQHTRSQRPGVVLGEESTLDDLITDVDADHVSEPSTRSNSNSEATTETMFQDETSSEGSEDEYEILSCDCSEFSEEEEVGLDDEDGDSFAWATFKDVPVITTVMEQLRGTFYDMLEAHSEPEKHAAWVAQIVFALAYAQRSFGLTHNDLHGNNVMYTETAQEFLYYKHQGTCYRVPTYGILIKLIDFDRAGFSLRLAGMKEPRHFLSSQFQPGDEAAGQYNVEPFFSQEHPRIVPNPSFDLCRFATSVYWDMFPQGPSVKTGHPLQEIFQQWMTQQDGSSVFFRSRQDRHDRYHGFDLYKAIARYCKDSATPRREILRLGAFVVPTVPLGTTALYIES